MYIYGASGHGRAILDVIESLNGNISGIFDDNLEVKNMLGYEVMGKIPEGFHFDQPLFVAIGDNKIRKKIVELVIGQTDFGTLAHPSAIISGRARIGNGTVIMEGGIVKVNTRIGDQVIVNTNASVDHDCVIGHYVHLAPQVTLCGGVTIGEGTFVGANTVVVPGVHIGAWCTIVAGTVVSKDVPDGTTWYGQRNKGLQPWEAGLEKL